MERHNFLNEIQYAIEGEKMEQEIQVLKRDHN